MKKLLLFIILILYPILGFSAYDPTKISNTLDSQIRDRAFNTPDKYTKDTKTLARYLTKPFKNDVDKLRVIAYWMASHIAYDSYKFNNNELNERNFNFKYDILKARAGICTDFTKLFQQLAEEANIKGVHEEKGYTAPPKCLKRKCSEKDKGAGHAWNSYVIKGTTYYIDTTWMAPQKIGHNNKSKINKVKHKREIKNRQRQKDVRVDNKINTFYFMFRPQDEIKERHPQIHFRKKN